MHAVSAVEETTNFFPLLLILLLAFVVPLALSRFKQLRLPIVVGEILAGILIGRSGLGWVEAQDPVLELLSEFGFVFLMFLSGMEIEFSSLGIFRSDSASTKQRGPGPVALGALSFVLTLVFSAVVGFVLVRLELARDPWMMALILSTTSLGVVVPVLKERGISSGRYGQALLVAALVADFATMFLITVLVALLSHGLTLDILLVGLLFVAFFFMYRFGMFFFNQLTPVRRAIQELSHATAQIKVRAAFTMMLIFVVLSEMLGTEVILGAFLAGAVVSLLRTPEDEELGEQLETIGFGFFIPIFFIMVGVDFNIRAILGSPQTLLLVPVLLVAAVLVKLVPGMIFRRAFNWRETWAAGLLLSARLSLIIAASAIGLRLGIISESVNAAIILVAIITVTIAPLLFLRILPEPEPEGARPIVVVGGEPLGLQVAEQLAAYNERVVLVDHEEGHVERARRSGLEVFLSQDGLTDPGLAPLLDQARSLVCTYSDTGMNYSICEQARTVYGIDHVVAHVNDPRAIADFERLDVRTMNAALDRAALLVLLTRSPGLYSLLTRAGEDKEVCEVVVSKSECIGKTLSQLKIPGDVLIMALHREGELLIPHGNTRLNEGDRLTLVGSCECADALRHLLAPLDYA